MVLSFELKVCLCSLANTKPLGRLFKSRRREFGDIREGSALQQPMKRLELRSLCVGIVKEEDFIAGFSICPLCVANYEAFAQAFVRNLLGTIFPQSVRCEILKPLHRHYGVSRRSRDYRGHPTGIDALTRSLRRSKIKFFGQLLLDSRPERDFSKKSMVTIMRPWGVPGT